MAEMEREPGLEFSKPLQEVKASVDFLTFLSERNLNHIIELICYFSGYQSTVNLVKDHSLMTPCYFELFLPHGSPPLSCFCVLGLVYLCRTIKNPRGSPTCVTLFMNVT